MRQTLTNMIESLPPQCIAVKVTAVCQPPCNGKSGLLELIAKEKIYSERGDRGFKHEGTW